MTMTTSTPNRPARWIEDDLIRRIDDLSHEARSMWRREPASGGPARTWVMRDLAALRLDLEALERRRRRAEPCVEHERTLHDCASRLERLRLHWRTVDA